ncbi:MAG: DUF2442 domain-containing protein [Anaerolineales bacterium]|nr:DUF2442 domain-containing protein [Anaerolineales bacterium]
MHKPISVKPLSEYKIWLEYSDGTSGVVDLSHLAGKGVFKYWDNDANFERVSIGESGENAWSEEIDLYPDALYENCW